MILRGSRGAGAFHSRYLPLLTTISTSRPPHFEHTSRACQSRTLAPAPYRSASCAGSGSTWCWQPRHQTIRRSPAFVTPPSVIGGAGLRFHGPIPNPRRDLPGSHRAYVTTPTVGSSGVGRQGGVGYLPSSIVAHLCLGRKSSPDCRLQMLYCNVWPRRVPHDDIMMVGIEMSTVPAKVPLLTGIEDGLA
jgi:hypothetical protein